MPSFARETNHLLFLTNTRLNKGLYAALPFRNSHQSERLRLSAAHTYPKFMGKSQGTNIKLLVVG